MKYNFERDLNMNIIKSFSGMSLIDLSTCQKVCNLDGINEFNQPTITPELSANYKPEFSFSLDNIDFEPDVLSKLLGQNSLTPKYNMELEGNRVVCVQARKHKKKRINKKWLKRYGYKEMYVPFNLSMKECSITPVDYDSSTYCIEGKL